MSLNSNLTHTSSQYSRVLLTITPFHTDVKNKLEKCYWNLQRKNAVLKSANSSVIIGLSQTLKSEH